MQYGDYDLFSCRMFASENQINLIFFFSFFLFFYLKIRAIASSNDGLSVAI
jgi:hypothetical protein